MVLRRVRTALRGLARRPGPARTELPPRSSHPDGRGDRPPRALVVGHFTFSDWYATFGDTEAMRVLLDWLDEAGIPYDVACHPDNGYPGVDLRHVDPEAYTVVAFVCGPWLDFYADDFFARFPGAARVGVNVSVLDERRAADFDVLIARDLAGASRPDLVFASTPSRDRPLIGTFLVHDQPEYGDRGRHAATHRAVEEYLARGEVVAVPLDTVHTGNATSTRDVEQLQALLRRVDAVVTSRLHGFVFALLAGTPAVALDPVAGGGKVTAQARAVGWPYVLDAAEASADRIAAMVREILDGDAAPWLVEARAAARAGVGAAREEFLAAMAEIDGSARARD